MCEKSVSQVSIELSYDRIGGKCSRKAETIGAMRLPFEPLIITTSPARTPLMSWSWISDEALPTRPESLRAPHRTARASAARRRTADRLARRRVRARERRAERRLRLPAPACRRSPRCDGRAPRHRRAEQRERRAHRYRVRIVALVDDSERAARTAQHETFAAPLGGREAGQRRGGPSTEAPSASTTRNAIAFSRYAYLGRRA